jgi:hypothetical protein
VPARPLDIPHTRPAQRLLITARTLAESLNDPFHRRLQTGRRLPACSDCYRLERPLPGETCTLSRTAAAPSLPWPAMWPATPPTMAPLMHPLASAGEKEASASRQTSQRSAWARGPNSTVIDRDEPDRTTQRATDRPEPCGRRSSSNNFRRARGIRRWSGGSRRTSRRRQNSRSLDRDGLSHSWS